MAVRNCVGNKCITSIWEGWLIISHQPVYVFVCVSVCVCVCVSLHKGGEERDGIPKRG